MSALAGSLRHTPGTERFGARRARGFRLLWLRCPRAWSGHACSEPTPCSRSLQVALTLALLGEAALFVKSFWQLARDRAGLSDGEGVTLQLDLPWHRFPDSAQRRAIDRGTRRQALRALFRAFTPSARPRTLPLAVPIGNGAPRLHRSRTDRADVGPPEVAPPGLPPPPHHPFRRAACRPTLPRFFQAVHVKVGPGLFERDGDPARRRPRLHDRRSGGARCRSRSSTARSRGAGTSRAPIRSGDAFGCRR